MEMFLGFVAFVKVFVLAMSALYILKFAYNVAKVSTLHEGKVEMGRHGFLWLGWSISYIIACIFS